MFAPEVASVIVTVTDVVTDSDPGLIAGVAAAAAAFTVSVAALLVTDPAELLTMTLNVDPLSVVVVAGVV
jgi:hypothetical protein